MERKIILKGIPASPGQVSGKVRILNSAKGINGLAKGGIIVTDFLAPDFVFALKSAPSISGIVTDGGGATCHAAIVARELKIPYIAGTLSATQKLKNNMEITIDGEKGIIYEA
ncbi:MAG: PEP-utilizing enzyme [bacterium]|nr:PEP-utilizing enzyme [bacterium]